MKYGQLNLGQIEAIVNKLGGMEGVLRFLSGELVVRQEHQLEVWKTINLGTGLKTTDDFRKALESAGFKISSWASGILGMPDFTVASEEVTIDLARVTVAELGFEEETTLDQIYERAKWLGLKICPPEVGPQLCLQYPDQPTGEKILIGMKPIAGPEDSLNVFNVMNDSQRWLHSYWDANPGHWSPSSQWVFRLPRLLCE
jgi:hypothetical protein